MHYLTSQFMSRCPTGRTNFHLTYFFKTTSDSITINYYVFYSNCFTWFIVYLETFVLLVALRTA